MKKLLLLVLVLSLSSITFASVITINFEQYSLYTQITNQYQASDGAVFTNALQLVAPFYDYTDYPPHSGNGVITNDPGDPIQVTFTDATVGVRTTSFWYTDPDGIVVTAYGAGGNVLTTVNGGAVYGTNSQVTLSYMGGEAISYFTISDVGGNADNLTVDDLSYVPVPLPEPGSLALLGSGVLGLAGVLRRKLVR